MWRHILLVLIKFVMQRLSLIVHRHAQIIEAYDFRRHSVITRAVWQIVNSTAETANFNLTTSSN